MHMQKISLHCFSTLQFFYDTGTLEKAALQLEMLIVFTVMWPIIQNIGKHRTNEGACLKLET